ncbi:MAG: hypothetical protein RhofKO_12930 [Rhodothermales bacterium]
MKTLPLFFVMLLICQIGYAQTVGTCLHGEARAELDVSDVRAGLYNTGGLFWRPGENIYTVPKDGTANAIFATSLWIGGLFPDSSRAFAGTAYGPWEYWPGPLDANGNPPADCSDYDRMYSVYAEDIHTYEADGTLTDDLRDWPYDLGAPVIDGDGVEGNYNLAGGDRPHIYGEQSVWWVMNDVGNTKEWFDTPPIGLEVQVQAFASSCLPGFPAEPGWVLAEAIERTTYYHFTVIHKGHQPLSETYMGWFTDGDLGNASDDYVGTDTTLGMGFYYNGDDFDEGPDSYGDEPPAIGYLMADGLHSYRGDSATTLFPGFNHGVYYDNSVTPSGHSGYRIDPYYMMQARWRDGTPLTEGGFGFGGTVPVSFSFPGNPVTRSYWSEENTDGNGSRNRPSDRRLVMSSGPFELLPGDTLAFTLVLPWVRGRDRLDSVRALRQAARLTRSAASNLMAASGTGCPAPPPQQFEHPGALGYYVLQQNYPEPFSQQTIIRYEVIDTVPVQLHVYDLLGRRVRTLVDGVQDAGVYDVVFEADDLPTGTYFYRLEAAGYVSITRRMVLQR